MRYRKTGFSRFTSFLTSFLLVSLYLIPVPVASYGSEIDATDKLKLEETRPVMKIPLNEAPPPAPIIVDPMPSLPEPSDDQPLKPPSFDVPIPIPIMPVEPIKPVPIKEAIADFEHVKPEEVTIYEQSPSVCTAQYPSSCPIEVFYSLAHSDGRHYHTARVAYDSLTGKWEISQVQQAQMNQAFRAEAYELLKSLPGYTGLTYGEVHLVKISESETPELRIPENQYYDLVYSVRSMEIRALGIREGSQPEELHYRVLLNESPRPFEMAMRQLVSSDAAIIFGMTQAVFEDLIRQGLIKIEINYNHFHTSAQVTLDPTFDPTIEPPYNQSVFFPDPLQLSSFYSYKIPRVIGYGLSFFTDPFNTVVPRIDAARFQIDDLTYLLDYHPIEVFGDVIKIDPSDNRPHFATVYSKGLPIKRIRYEYQTDKILVVIDYLDNSQGRVVSRKIEMSRFEDGKYQPKRASDFDKEGKIVAINEFNYSVFNNLPNAGIPFTFHPIITRKNGDGSLRSTIYSHPVTDFWVEWLIVLANNQQQKTFDTDILESLLPQALEFEDSVEQEMALLEQNRAVLLAQVDGTIRVLNSVLQDTYQKLNEFQSLINQNPAVFKAVIQESILTLKGITAELQKISEKEGVAGALREEIQAYLAKVTSYMDPANASANSLSLQVTAYIQLMTDTALSPFQVETEYAENVLAAKLIHREKILAAKTWEELLLLSHSFIFPEKRPVMPILPVPDPRDPREILKKFSAEGTALLEKAKNQILASSVPAALAAPSQAKNVSTPRQFFQTVPPLKEWPRSSLKPLSSSYDSHRRHRKNKRLR